MSEFFGNVSPPHENEVKDIVTAAGLNTHNQETTDQSLKTMNSDILKAFIKSTNLTDDIAMESIEKHLNKIFTDTPTYPQPLSPVDDAGNTVAFVEHFSSYQKDVMEECIDNYNKIEYTHKTDPLGREIHRFDDGRSPPLIAVVFKNSSKQLVSINNFVMKMKTFIEIDEMKYCKYEKEEQANHQIRDPYPIDEGYVRAYSGRYTYEFKNTTVPLLMMVLTKFSQLYNTF